MIGPRIHEVLLHDKFIIYANENNIDPVIVIEKAGLRAIRKKLLKGINRNAIIKGLTNWGEK